MLSYMLLGNLLRKAIKFIDPKNVITYEDTHPFRPVRERISKGHSIVMSVLPSFSLFVTTQLTLESQYRYATPTSEGEMTLPEKFSVVKHKMYVHL
jgi:hypothetical protein